ncbi:MAG: HAD family hydrolase [Muribaculum sp.]|nr:HAD family hydrolase [Muribaculum sp.]
MRRIVVFDLDGTLSDSIHSIKYCADRALAPLGYGPFSEEAYKYFVGDGAANLIRRALAAGGDPDGMHFEEAFARYKEFFAVDCMYEVKPYEGVPELLAALRERGCRLAVLSNKPHAETIRVIESLFGRDCFDVIWGQREDVPIKPDPAGVFRILKQLGGEALETLYLGDTDTDMRTGTAAGAFTVGALWGFRGREELERRADAIISHPMELLAYLEK